MEHIFGKGAAQGGKGPKPPPARGAVAGMYIFWWPEKLQSERATNTGPAAECTQQFHSSVSTTPRRHPLPSSMTRTFGAEAV